MDACSNEGEDVRSPGKPKVAIAQRTFGRILTTVRVRASVSHYAKAELWVVVRIQNPHSIQETMPQDFNQDEIVLARV